MLDGGGSPQSLRSCTSWPLLHWKIHALHFLSFLCPLSGLSAWDYSGKGDQCQFLLLLAAFEHNASSKWGNQGGALQTPRYWLGMSLTSSEEQVHPLSPGDIVLGHSGDRHLRVLTSSLQLAYTTRGGLVGTARPVFGVQGSLLLPMWKLPSGFPAADQLLRSTTLWGLPEQSPL